MDTTRFAVVLSIVFLLTPLAGLAEDNAGTVAAKVVTEAKALRKANQDDAADKLLREAAKSHEDRLKQKPDDAQARFALAQLQVHLEQVEAAKVNLERAMQLEPNNAAMYAFKGRFHGVAKEYPEAIKAYRRSVELDPKNAETRRMFAMCLGNGNQTDEALIQAREAIKLDPNDSDGLMFYSLVLLQAGKYEEWEQTIRARIQLQPTSIELRELLVIGFIAQQRHEKAYRECLELQKLDSNNVERESKLVVLATQARQTLAAEKHMARLAEFRKTGKYDSDYAPRDDFFVGEKRVAVKEYFDHPSKNGIKYMFYVLDDQGQEQRKIVLGSYEPFNEALRSEGKIKDGERAFYLMSYSDTEKLHFGMYPVQPTYEQSRAMAIEIIEGTRLPIAPSAKAEKNPPVVR